MLLRRAAKLPGGTPRSLSQPAAVADHFHGAEGAVVPGIKARLDPCVGHDVLRVLAPEVVAAVVDGEDALEENLQPLIVLLLEPAADGGVNLIVRERRFRAPVQQPRRAACRPRAAGL